jgi:hypothetical protein
MCESVSFEDLGRRVPGHADRFNLIEHLKPGFPSVLRIAEDGSFRLRGEMT